MLTRSRLKVWGVILILGSFDFDATFVVLGSKLNPTRRGLWNGYQEGGGAFHARPYKNPFKGLFGPIFLHRKGWGIKITSENFF